ncbi:MAG TPA: ABC transporter ATP-binding protein/permease [Dongiaceae bacterium]|jgi:putative ATP-binding cassette transporter|nr:ABC transporter ATP-binding protein/permease [Dongiaceae bacterium]
MTLPLIGAVERGFFSSVWRLVKPYWYSEEKWIARALLVVVIGLNLGQVFLNVQFNSWYGRFYDALQQKNLAIFWHEILVFLFLATCWVAVGVYEYYLRNSLEIRWRRWLTRRYLRNWMTGRVFYRMELTSRGTDNPDQRIQEDLNNFPFQTLNLALDGMSNIVNLVSFVTILWGLSGAISFVLAGLHITIPGYMLWCALLYAIVGTVIMHLIGRRLAGLFFTQQRFEADFRYSLVRVRENAEGIALYGGEEDEHARLSDSFGRVFGNWFQIMRMRKRLLWFSFSYNQLAVLFPFVTAGPQYFAGTIMLGTLMRISNAFGQVQSNLSWFITSYTTIAEWKASVDRLISFDRAMAESEAAGAAGVGIAVQPEAEPDVRIEHVDLDLPDGKPLVADISADIKPGERVLVSGPSGSGKSTLFRALAGIWPYGAGKIVIPQLKRLLFLPQRPYVPIGSLRNAVTFPAVPGKFSDAEIAEALTACKLGDYASRLDESHHWDRRLSPGEQQRLALARAFLQRPDWLFLDEATSALDPETEAALYKLLIERLPETSLVSIAHRTNLAAFHRRRLQFKPAPGGMKVVSEPVS